MPVTQPVFDIEELTGFVGSESFQFVDIDTFGIDTENIIPQVTWECPINMDVDQGISLDRPISIEDNHDQDQCTADKDDFTVEKKKEDDRWTTLFGEDFDPNVVLMSTAPKAKADHEEGQTEELTFGKKPPDKMEAVKESPLKFPWEDDDDIGPPVAKIVVEDPRKKILCDQCGKMLSGDSLRRHHINIHLKLRRYKCDLCEKSYYDSNALKVHKAKHTGEKKFICGICDKGFFRKWDLRKHTDWHVSLYYEYQNKMKRGVGCAEGLNVEN